jgi:thermolabile hemolysin
VNKRIIKFVLLGVLPLLSCCALQLHDPAPDLSPMRQEYPWLVHCETAESHQPDEELVPGVRHERWLWAQDGNGDAIELAGQLEDGFLAVRGIKRHDSATLRETTLAELRQACLDTLIARNPDRPLELGKVRAARQGEGIDVTMVFPPQTPPRYPVRRMVVFGDSLSDTGRLKNRLHVFPGSPYWLGRFSNGPGWVDYLAAETGLAAQNHSYGGASVTLHESVPGDELFARIKQGGQLLVTGSLEQQVDDYIHLNLGGAQLQHPERTVFIIWAGANDYIWKEPFTGAITTFLNTTQGAAGYERVVDEVIAAITQQIRKLHDAGARRFMVINLPDLGETPIVLQNKTYYPPHPPGSDDERKLELARRLSQLSNYHNQQLRDVVKDLERQFPYSDILLEDSALAINQLLQQESPVDFGFSLEQHQQTLVHDGQKATIQQRCYSGGYLGSTNPKEVCSEQENALFWDVIHPTTYAHCWEAWFIGRTLASAQWIAPMPEQAQYRQWCELVSSRQNGHRETAWRLSGL